ncbi:T-cell surface glycoprotein CD8 alpha chain [Leptodactylus fuscus]|uniref:T-cell surface glycoprotein CD8 alpha chain n=1 Tax=Leptodactylus fuscus TaxID=238119 RepID=UPI003F4E513F
MISRTMLSIASLQVLFCLFLCTHQLKLTSDTLQRGSSSPVTLKCEAENHEATDVGIFWFRHKKGAVSPQSIVYYSSTRKATYKDQTESGRFKPSISASLFTLVIERFDQTDQGTYYCLINKNSVLHISPGLKLFYPEVTTPKTTTTKAPARTTGPAGDSCNCTPGKETTEALGLSCDLYVWAPLAGLCGFFLICFLITFVMLCCRTRRRRCRCKPRPMDEKNGKMNIPNRHI